MKILLSFIILFAMAKSCDEKKVQDNVTSVQYSAASRGSSFEVKANKDVVVVLESRDAKIKEIDITGGQWKDILSSLRNIDFKNIENIEAPSTAHQYDGAPLANLKITTQKGSYTSATFDDGNPPKELKEIIDILILLTGKK